MQHSVTLYVIDRGSRLPEHRIRCLCGWEILHDLSEPPSSIDDKYRHSIEYLVHQGRNHMQAHMGIGVEYLDGIKPEAWSEPELIGDGERSGISPESM